MIHIISKTQIRPWNQKIRVIVSLGVYYAPARLLEFAQFTPFTSPSLQQPAVSGNFYLPGKAIFTKIGKNQSSIFFAHVIQNHRLLERTFVKNSTLSTWKSNYRNQLFYAPRKLLNFSSCMKSSLKAEEEWIRRLSRFEPLEHFDAPVDRS